MAQPDVLALSKQGDPVAIATLLNRAFHNHGVVAKTHRQQYCLRILLESEQVIDRAAAIALIRQGMERLRPENIHSVQIYGQPIGATSPIWQESFDLEAAATSVVHPESVPPKIEPVAELAGPDANLPISPPAPGQTRGQALPPHPPLSPKPIDMAGIGALGTGLVLAIVLFSLGPLNLLFRGFLILVHEVGHAVTHWLFGRPAIPTVNLLFGGGVTLVLGQSALLIGLIYAGMAFLIYCLRSYPRLQGCLVAIAILYTLCLSGQMNTMLATFMGHGMELVAIFVCLYLAASGYFCRITGDRTIYAMLGFFTYFCDVQFSWRLIHDPDFRSWYEGGIGGMIDNDFVILANEYVGVDLSAIATGFLLACLVTPILVFLVLRYQNWLIRGINSLLQPAKR